MREYRKRKSVGNFEPRRRGRKPLDIKLLQIWEFEWYKALHLLREGTQLPPDPNFVVVNERETKAQLQWWKSASYKDILGEMQPGVPPEFDELPETERERAKVRWTMSEWKWLKDFAENQRESEISALEHWLKPRITPSMRGRREIWATASESKASIKAVGRACEKWRLLPDVRSRHVAVFADHVQANIEKFQRMKADTRYPGPHADDSRLDYLARGLAAVMVGASPITAIHRLRLMRHEPGGPEWVEKRSYVDGKGKPDEVPAHCGCWRCELQASRRYWRTLRSVQEGL